MGDKYETGRAMLHLEFEKLSGQVEQYAQLKKTLNSINPHLDTAIVGFGSIVRTTAANYFISIPAGVLNAGKNSYYAVGMSSPIAKALLNKKQGEKFIFNGKSIKIIATE